MRSDMLPILLGLVLPEILFGAELCVSNGTDQTLHFTVQAAASGERRAADLAPDQSLCLPGDAGGTVAAFESAQSIEGCSRLVPAGERDRLLDFARFDRCRWQSHDRESLPDD